MKQSDYKELDISEVEAIDEVLKFLEDEKHEVLVKMKLSHYRDCIKQAEARGYQRALDDVLRIGFIFNVDGDEVYATDLSKLKKLKDGTKG